MLRLGFLDSPCPWPTRLLRAARKASVTGTKLGANITWCALLSGLTHYSISLLLSVSLSLSLPCLLPLSNEYSFKSGLLLSNGFWPEGLFEDPKLKPSGENTAQNASCSNDQKHSGSSFRLSYVRVQRSIPCRGSCIEVFSKAWCLASLAGYT